MFEKRCRWKGSRLGITKTKDCLTLRRHLPLVCHLHPIQRMAAKLHDILCSHNTRTHTMITFPLTFVFSQCYLMYLCKLMHVNHYLTYHDSFYGGYRELYLIQFYVFCSIYRPKLSLSCTIALIPLHKKDSAPPFSDPIVVNSIDTPTKLHMTWLWVN